jgi:hypothetical protein
MLMNPVDEPRRDGEPRHVQVMPGGQITGVTHRDDPITADDHVTHIWRRPAAVVDHSVPQDKIVAPASRGHEQSSQNDPMCCLHLRPLLVVLLAHSLQLHQAQ